MTAKRDGTHHYFNLCPRSKPLDRKSSKPEAWKAQRLLVKRQRAGTVGPSTERCDDGIGERALTFLQRDHRWEDLLLMLHNEHLGLKHALDCCSDFMGREAVGTVQHPHDLDHDHNANEAGVFLG